MRNFNWRRTLKYGVICGGCILYIALVGILEAFQVRSVVNNVLPLGEALLIVISLGMGYTTARNLGEGNILKAFLASLIVGVIGGLITILFTLSIEPINMRNMFVNASPALIEILSSPTIFTFFALEPQTMINGLLMLAAGITICSLIGTFIYILPNFLRTMIITGLLAILFAGMLQDFVTRFTPMEGLYEAMSDYDSQTTAVRLIEAQTQISVEQTVEQFATYEEETVDFLFGRNGLSTEPLGEVGYWRYINGVTTIFLIFALLPLIRLIIGFLGANIPRPLQLLLNWFFILLGLVLLVIQAVVLQLALSTIGLVLAAAIMIFVIGMCFYIFKTRNNTLTGQTVRASFIPTQQKMMFWVFMAVGLNILIFLPQATDSYVTQILFLVGLYTAMGLGLNIELGWAGLLDLGFSGFFAIGAYTVAIITSTGELGMNGSFWVAVPIAVIISAIAGVVLGIPVLRTRGDYLAIITLGLAEIIRIMVKSNALQDFLGGAQGVLNIAKPQLGWASDIFGLEELKDPMHFYYLVLMACILIAFLAWRLQHARIGRNWMALREDEDVAEAMGINLIATKLLAFGIGASFAGLSGAIFAAQLGSVFPDSFGLLVSINVVSLVIIGGLGSIPGVIVGALVLVGLPELLREFSEFRLLLYGMLLVVMMLVKPEGLWPSEATRRELHAEEDDDEIDLEIIPEPSI